MIGFVRTIFYLIDHAIYNMIEKVYSLMMSIASHEVFDSATLNVLANRIYVVIGIIMLFLLAFKLINYIINPDDFYSSEKGIGKVVYNIMITLVLIVLVPFIFDLAYELQGQILESNFLSKLILGNEQYSNENYNYSDYKYNYISHEVTDSEYTDITKDVFISLDSRRSLTNSNSYSEVVNSAYVFLEKKGRVYGYKSDLSISELDTDYFLENYFFECNMNDSECIVTGNPKVYTLEYIDFYNYIDALSTDSDRTTNKRFYLNFSKDYYSTITENPKESGNYVTSFKYMTADIKGAREFAGIVYFTLVTVDDKINPDNMSTGLSDAISEKNITEVGEYINEKDGDTYFLNYPIFITLILGVIVLIILVLMCIDIAIRAIKLGILQLLSPIPIIFYIDPKTKSAFNSWVKECTTVYIDLFLRIILLSFLLFVIQIITKIQYGDNFVILFMLIGLLLFIQQAPKWMEEAFPILKGTGSLLQTTRTMLGATGGLIQGKKSAGGRGAVVGMFKGANAGSNAKGMYGAFDTGLDKAVSDFGGNKMLQGDIFVNWAKRRSDKEVEEKLIKFDKVDEVKKGLKENKGEYQDKFSPELRAEYKIYNDLKTEIKKHENKKEQVKEDYKIFVEKEANSLVNVRKVMNREGLEYDVSSIDGLKDTIASMKSAEHAHKFSAAEHENMQYLLDFKNEIKELTTGKTGKDVKAKVKQRDRKALEIESALSRNKYVEKDEIEKVLK